MTLADWLTERPFTLTMSSGFFGFFAHAGMLEALVERGLRPARITGSSAGALVGGVYSSGVEPVEIARELLRVRRADFWDPRPGLGLLRGHLFHDRIATLTRGARLEHARVPTSLVVHDVLSHRAVAKARGALAPIIQASCAVPFLFHPVWLDGRPYLDGGILDRPGLSPIAKGERTLYHHLASRSPWRLSLDTPVREHMTTLVLADLPRSGPFALDVGHRAYERAKRATSDALDRPWSQTLVAPLVAPC